MKFILTGKAYYYLSNYIEKNLFPNQSNLVNELKQTMRKIAAETYVFILSISLFYPWNDFSGLDGSCYHPIYMLT